MSDEYRIISDKKITRNGYRNSFEEILDTIIVYDVIPPFKVYKNNSDITDEFLKYASKQGYEFVNQYKLAEDFPKWLVKLMNKALKERLYYEITCPSGLIQMDVYPVQDIKSIDGFYKLYKKNYVTIANNGKLFLCHNLSDNTFCLLEYDGKLIRYFTFNSSDELRDKIKIVRRKK